MNRTPDIAQRHRTGAVTGTAKDTARKLVALWLDLPADQVDVVMDYRIDPEVMDMIAGANKKDD